jgi:hypothetical protein
LASGDVGVEYRGRLGHPSSYGLLAGVLGAGAGGAEFARLAAGASQLPPPLNGEDVIVGTLEPEYAEAVNAVCLQHSVSLSIGASAAGEISSSSVVFSKLAAVLCALLKCECIDLGGDELWQIWDSA